MSNDKLIEVSVVVPFHNRKEFLRPVISSIIQQETQYSYEIILVDDGSTDEWKSEIPTSDKIKIISQKNNGAARARLHGVSYAKGQIIVFHDSDDIMLPNKVEDLTTSLLLFPDAILSFGKIIKKSEIFLPSDDLPVQHSLINSPYKHFIQNSYPIAPAMCIAVYKKYFLYIDNSSKDFLAANDYHLQFQLSYLGNFVELHKPCAIYDDISPGRISSSHFLKQYTYSFISLIKNYCFIDLEEHEVIYKKRIIEQGFFILESLGSKEITLSLKTRFLYYYIYSGSPVLHAIRKIREYLTAKNI